MGYSLHAKHPSKKHLVILLKTVMFNTSYNYIASDSYVNL